MIYSNRDVLDRLQHVWEIEDEDETDLIEFEPEDEDFYEECNIYYEGDLCLTSRL